MSRDINLDQAHMVRAAKAPIAKLENGAHISRTWNAILDKGRTVVATSQGDVFMRVVRVRSQAGVLQGRATNGDWVVLPADALFRVTP